MRPAVYPVVYLIVILLGCSSEDAAICDSNSVDIGHGSCIVFTNGETLGERQDAITAKAREAVALVNEIMPVEEIKITVRASAQNAIPEIGVGGYNPDRNEVIISFDPNFPDLDQTIEEELAFQFAHEMHHAKRRRAVGYGSTLLQAAVSEGLADCFAEEVTNKSPSPWSLALTGDDLDLWLANAMDVWNESGYDHAQWFLGSTQDIPRWTGYAIGYKLVKDFIMANPDRKASDLFDEPASSFEP